MFPRFPIGLRSVLARTIGPLTLIALFFLLFPPDRPNSQPASARGSVTSVQVANNTTPVLLATGSRILIGMESYSVDTTTVWVKLYNASAVAGVTCGQAAPAPVARYLIVGQTGGAGYITTNNPGDGYTSGIVACFTTGYADTDTTAPAASKFVVNFHWY